MPDCNVSEACSNLLLLLLLLLQQQLQQLLLLPPLLLLLLVLLLPLLQLRQLQQNGSDSPIAYKTAGELGAGKTQKRYLQVDVYAH